MGGMFGSGSKKKSSGMSTGVPGIMVGGAAGPRADMTPTPKVSVGGAAGPSSDPEPLGLNSSGAAGAADDLRKRRATTLGGRPL